MGGKSSRKFSQKIEKIKRRRRRFRKSSFESDSSVEMCYDTSESGRSLAGTCYSVNVLCYNVIVLFSASCAIVLYVYSTYI